MNNRSKAYPQSTYRSFVELVLFSKQTENRLTQSTRKTIYANSIVKNSNECP